MNHLLATLALLCPLTTLAQGIPSPENFTDKGKPITVITRVFNQLVSFTYPKGFVPAFNATHDGFHIQEYIPNGESRYHWSQMVTITGLENRALDLSLTPEHFAFHLLSGYKGSCPTSFNAAILNEIQTTRYRTITLVLSCGMVVQRNDLPYSESALIMIIQGKKDFYNIQWAERGNALNRPLPIDKAKWIKRYQLLSPIRLCPVIAGENFPFYPSCSDIKKNLI